MRYLLVYATVYLSPWIAAYTMNTSKKEGNTQTERREGKDGEEEENLEYLLLWDLSSIPLSSLQVLRVTPADIQCE